MNSKLADYDSDNETDKHPTSVQEEEQEIETYPPHDWGPRPAPTGEEIEYALKTARKWWWNAAFGGADDCLETYLDEFGRYLGERVRNRDMHNQNGLSQFTEQKS